MLNHTPPNSPLMSQTFYSLVLVNAYVIGEAFRQLDCKTVYEHARKDNAPSRGMIEGCGLKLDPRYRCVMFHDAGRLGEEFTK